MKRLGYINVTYLRSDTLVRKRSITLTSNVWWNLSNSNTFNWRTYNSSKKEKMLDKLIREETKKELEKSIKNLCAIDNIIICGLYGIKTKKITQKRLAKQLGCTQSCIAKKHNKILNLIKEDLKY